MGINGLVSLKPKSTASQKSSKEKSMLLNERYMSRITSLLDPYCKPDQRTVLAMWVLLKFIDQVDPMAHYPASYPSQIFFLKDNIGYEIVVIYEGEGSNLRLLQPEDELKYIIVVPHIAMVHSLPTPKAECLFATVAFNGEDEPEITFYTEEIKNG